MASLVIALKSRGDNQHTVYCVNVFRFDTKNGVTKMSSKFYQYFNFRYIKSNVGRHSSKIKFLKKGYILVIYHYKLHKILLVAFCKVEQKKSKKNTATFFSSLDKKKKKLKE